ncbi:MAG: nucleotidyltransferase, partial [Bacteroidetes bacterium]|nr:nucleotidyltransferase [Bacteroidota bacterium]
MFGIDSKNKIDKILVEIGVALDLTKAQYDVIESRYTAVGNHLKKDTSLLRPYSPTIMPQGSFLLGTMVKPILEDDELDVDIVCRLSGKKESWAQIDLKQEVKKQIEADDTYKQMLNKEEGKRCWRIDYAEDTKFHMDILPSIVGVNHYTLLEKTFSNLSSQDVTSLAIRITDNTLNNYKWDKNTQNWLPSNPFGYAAWFNERKKTTTQKLRLLSESIKPLPKYQAEKMPLQRAIQILKRHRDIMFGGDDDKPISIIITTLAAKSYNGELSIVDTLINILANMKSHINYEWSSVHNRSIAKIENPINTEENFADK